MSVLCKRNLVLFVIFLLACLVRFYGINFGLPNTRCRPDEEVIISKTLKFFSGDLNPRFFKYPTLYMYVLFGVYTGYFLIRLAFGGSISEFLQEMAIAPTNFYLISRGLSAVFGALTTVVVFLIAKYMFDKKTALAASFFMSIVYLHVRESHFGTTDVTMTFFIGCATLYILKCYTEKHKRHYTLAGIFTGLATATKYGGIFLIFPMMLAHFLSSSKPGSNQQKSIWFYSIAAIISFLVGTPFMLFDFTTFMKDFMYEVHHLTTDSGVMLARGWWYHIRYTLPYGMGWLMFLSALIGGAMYLKQDSRKALILYVFPCVFYIATGKGRTVFLRYMIPVLPFMCIASATYVVHVHHILAKSLVRSTVLPILVIIIAGHSLYYSFLFDSLISKADNRVIAEEWISQYIPPDSSIYQSGSLFGRVQLKPSIEALEEQYQEILNRGATGTLMRAQIDYAKNVKTYKGYKEWKYD
jgi:4-amino-4-deoxy-L-arabinose transferase-like glycosyltransferase